MKPLITVLAYRCNGVQTRRCCVVGRWDSDFETFTTTDPDAAAEWMVKFMAPKDNAYYEGSYDLKVLINGAEEDYWGEDDSEDDYDVRQSYRNEILREANAKYATHLNVVADAA